MRLSLDNRPGATVVLDKTKTELGYSLIQQLQYNCMISYYGDIYKCKTGTRNSGLIILITFRHHHSKGGIILFRTNCWILHCGISRELSGLVLQTCSYYLANSYAVSEIRLKFKCYYEIS